jgi:hypothetical protein
MLVLVGVLLLLTALYVALTGRRSWAMLPSRKAGGFALIAAVIAIIVGGSAIGGTGTPKDQLTDSRASTSSSATQTPTPTPTPEVEVKEESTTTPVPFGQVAASDPNALVGTSAVTVVGVDGVKTLTYRVTYTDGVETDRELVSETVTTPPVDQVTTTGSKQPVVVAPKPAPPAPAPPAAAPPASAGFVHPGAFCSGAGSTGVTDRGTPMVCKTSPTDSRLRWRAA